MQRACIAPPSDGKTAQAGRPAADPRRWKRPAGVPTGRSVTGGTRPYGGRLDRAADRAQDLGHLRPEEDEGDDRDDRDEGEDQGVLSEALAPLIPLKELVQPEQQGSWIEQRHWRHPPIPSGPPRTRAQGTYVCGSTSIVRTRRRRSGGPDREASPTLPR